MNGEIKRKIDHLRDLLVGKIPVPTDQVKQITLGLIYKFMSDIDEKNRELGGSSFFSGDYQQYAWKHILDHSLSAYDRVILYSEGLEKMSLNPNIPQLFRDIFKGAFLPFKDPATVDQFLKGLNEFEYQHSEDLGDAYEYLLSIMGSQGDAGQFRTPRHIIDFIVAAVEPQKEDRILDPACGTAGFLVSAYKYILNQNTLPGSDRPGSALSAADRKKITENFVGYDISQDMMRISLVNMYLHQFTDPQIYEYDTLTSLDRWNDPFDCILTNPPFMSPSGGIRPHNRFGVHSTRSEVLFVDYIMEHLSPGGKAGVIVPEGIIFQSQNAYKQLRKKLVEEGYLFAVVSLPAGVFQPYSGVKTSILLLDRRLAQKAKSILFVKVESDGYDLGAQRKPVEKNDLPDAKDNILKYKYSLANGGKSENDRSLIISKEEIANNGDFNFSIERYQKKEIDNNRKYPMCSLREIITLEYGSALPKNKRKDGFYPVYGSNGIVDYHDKYLVKGPFIIVGRKGSAGKVNISMKDGYPIDTTFYVKIIDPQKVDLNYLYYQLKELGLENVNVQSGVPGLNRNDAYQKKVPLPPLEIQREIVAEIEGYQKIIDGARQVVENWKPRIKIDLDWPRVKLGELSEIVRGSSPRPKSDKRFYGGNVPRLMVADVTRDGMYSTPQIDFLTEEGAKLSRPMKKGSLIMAVSGQPGLCTILATDACIHDGFIGFRNLDSLKIIVEFAYFILSMMKVENSGLSVGAIFKNLKSDQVKEIIIPIPPLETQRKIILEIQEQQKGVDACKKLIETYEAKIKEKIGEVWGQ